MLEQVQHLQGQRQDGCHREGLSRKIFELPKIWPQHLSSQKLILVMLAMTQVLRDRVILQDLMQLLVHIGLHPEVGAEIIALFFNF